MKGTQNDTVDAQCSCALYNPDTNVKENPKISYSEAWMSLFITCLLGAVLTPTLCSHPFCQVLCYELERKEENM